MMGNIVTPAPRELGVGDSVELNRSIEPDHSIERLKIQDSGVSRRAWSPVEKAFVIAASLVFVALSVGSIRKESVTTNEVAHLPAGLSYLQRFDARMNIEHPPLIKVIAALPVLLLHGKADYEDSSWKIDNGAKAEYVFGGKFFTWNANHRALLFAARLPMIALTLLLGLSLYYLARRLAGPWGAALTLILFVTSPFFLSYGPLVYTDIPIATFSLWTMWCFASLWKEPIPRNALLFAASLAAALLTKFSAVFLFPAIFLCWVWFRFAELTSPVVETSPQAGRTFRREQLTVAGMLLSMVVVYLFYMGIFHRSNPLNILQDDVNSINATGGHVVLLHPSIRIIAKYPMLGRILLPLWLYIGGLAFVFGNGDREMYFLGHWHAHGVWYYFPVMSFFKLAPGMVLLFLLLAVLMAASFVRNRRKALTVVMGSNGLHLQAILLTFLTFAAIPMASDLNVGVRHFSVPITLAILLCALVVPLTRSFFAPKGWRVAVGVIAALVFCSIVTAALTYPHYLAYYNFFRFNVPKQEIAINSNLSLGQSMDELAEFFHDHHVSTPYVDKWTSELPPDVYIPGARAWECDNPDPLTPEWVAASTSVLLRHDEPRMPTPSCEYLLRYPSWNIGDGAVIVFHLTSSNSAR